MWCTSVCLHWLHVQTMAGCYRTTTQLYTHQTCLLYLVSFDRLWRRCQFAPAHSFCASQPPFRLTAVHVLFLKWARAETLLWNSLRSADVTFWNTVMKVNQSDSIILTASWLIDCFRDTSASGCWCLVLCVHWSILNFNQLSYLESCSDNVHIRVY